MNRSSELILALGVLLITASMAFVITHPERIALAANAGLAASVPPDFNCPTGWSKDVKVWHSRISYVSGFQNGQPVCTELEISAMSDLSWQENTSEDGHRIYITIMRREEPKK